MFLSLRPNRVTVSSLDWSAFSFSLLIDLAVFDRCDTFYGLLLHPLVLWPLSPDGSAKFLLHHRHLFSVSIRVRFRFRVRVRVRVRHLFSVSISIGVLG